MRFITEFENDGTKFDQQVTAYRKERGQLFLGNLIAESFGWEERRQTTLHGPVKERYTIEIEAFPMDKWIEFKQKLGRHINERDGIISPNFIINIIVDLESFGKPAGDTITNQKLTNGTK